MSVLVTTQMKVSSGVGFHSGVSRNSTSASSARELGLHLLDRQRRRAGERGVVGELRRQPLVDLGDARIDGGKPGDVGRLGGAVALVGRLRHGRTARRIALLPFLDQVLALAHQRRQRRSPLAPRAAICASEAAASEPCAHCAVWNISRAKLASRAALLPTQGDAPP